MRKQRLLLSGARGRLVGEPSLLQDGTAWQVMLLFLAASFASWRCVSQACVDRMTLEPTCSSPVVDDCPPPIPADILVEEGDLSRVWLTRDLATRLRDGLCMEIGPLIHPWLNPENPNVRFMDHATREGIIQKYRHDSQVNHSLHRVPHIHYVWRPRLTFMELMGTARFQLVYASHVIEHVPNLVGWLESVAGVLEPTGVLRLVVPDKRYCFDFRRRTSSLAEVVEAHIEDRTQPSLRATYEHAMLVGGPAGEWNDPRLHWADRSPNAADFTTNPTQHARGMQRIEMQRDRYTDVHCWQFTPASLVAIVNFLSVVHLLSLKVVRLVPTQRDSQEFFCRPNITRQDLGGVARQCQWQCCSSCPIHLTLLSIYTTYFDYACFKLLKRVVAPLALAITS